MDGASTEGLAIATDEAFQRWSWRVQRAGWVGQAGYSRTNAFVLVVTLMLVDLGLSLAKRRSPWIEKWVEGVPLVIVEHGRPLEERMAQARGEISIVPWRRPEAGERERPAA